MNKVIADEPVKAEGFHGAQYVSPSGHPEVAPKDAQAQLVLHQEALARAGVDWEHLLHKLATSSPEAQAAFIQAASDQLKAKEPPPNKP